MNRTRIIPFKMRYVYDLDDYFVLQKEGWKLPNSNTLRRYKKEELVGIIRMLEHNWSGAIKQNMLQNARLENFYNFIKREVKKNCFQI